MLAVISTFGATWIVTRALMGPFLMATIFPRRILRALSFMEGDLEDGELEAALD